METEPKIYTFEEVAQHSRTKDCWLVLFGKVYDITSFMDDHPGGDEVLLTSTGKDATEDFEDVGHSNTAREMLDKYYIGDINGSALPIKAAYVSSIQGSHNHSKSSELGIKILQFLVPLLILGLAIGIRLYTKKE